MENFFEARRHKGKYEGGKKGATLSKKKHKKKPTKEKEGKRKPCGHPENPRSVKAEAARGSKNGGIYGGIGHFLWRRAERNSFPPMAEDARANSGDHVRNQGKFH